MTKDSSSIYYQNNKERLFKKTSKRCLSEEEKE